MSTQPTTATNFLDLPGELRNDIYKQAVRSETNLKITSSGTILQSPHAFVSKQVRNEFLPLWEANDLSTVDEIRVRVKDCKFDPLIQILRTSATNLRPQLLIYMTLAAPRNECLEAIESWLRYCKTASRHRRRGEYYFDVECSPWDRGELFQIYRMLSARSRVWDLRLPDEAWFISRTLDDYVLVGQWRRGPLESTSVDEHGRTNA
jgi:hypothetical protein